MPNSSFTTFAARYGAIGVRAWEADARTSVVVLIHGVDGSSESWAAIADSVASHKQVVALDLRGRGGADMDGPWGVQAHADDVASFIASLGARVTVVGHSFGGHVAARVAADRPELVTRLVLVDGGPPRLIPDGMTPAELADGALSNIVANLSGKGASVEAVTADFHSMVSDDAATRAVFAVEAPIQLLRAELGVAPSLPPVVPDAVVAEMVEAGVVLNESVVAGATHFSILGDHGGAVISALRTGLAG